MSYFAFDQRLNPEGYARELLKEFKITGYPVDPKYIIERLGIKFREDDDLGSKKVDGFLYRKNGKSLIVVNSSIPYEGRRNFSTAHELGHATIKGHDQEKYSCSALDIESYSSHERKAESEANRFAAELLMPEQFVSPFLKKRDVSFETIHELSDQFKVSLTAAAIRVLCYTIERYALIASYEGKVLWSSSSRSFKNNIRKGKLHQHTYAYDAFTLDKNLPDRFRPVLAHAWLDDEGIRPNFEILEHSYYFSDLGMVLTLLSIPFKEDEVEEEELFEY